jgi:alpha-methylacyl-CoA racemase
MTGWGQQGPLASRAGHDINYIALTGALAAMGRPGEPATIPLNLVGDFGGGSMFLVLGILAALWERERSGRGQVVDAAIVDGVASLMTMFTGLVPAGLISLDRADNVLGGAAPYYRCYLCRDGREISVGPLEPAFFAEFIARLGLDEFAGSQDDRARWPELAGALARVFSGADRQHWVDLFEGSDACVAPVLTAEEAPLHPHHAARETYQQHDGLIQSAPAPRFSRTPGAVRPALDASAMLERWRSAPG